eukprot:4583534-Amphidinium_carterae.1
MDCMSFPVRIRLCCKSRSKWLVKVDTCTGTDLLNIHILDVHAAIESEYHKLIYLVLWPADVSSTLTQAAACR